MTKLTIIWLAIMSFLATLLSWIFHGSLFTICYSPFPGFKGYTIIEGQPLINCIAYASGINFGSLFLAPIAMTLIIYAIYVTLFNRPLPYSKWLLWLFWLTAFYFFTFQITYLPILWF